MNDTVARSIAMVNHTGQRTRSGDLVLEHLTRVAAAVAPGDRAVAWLHDVLERSDVDPDDLRAQGMTPVELAALELLTREPAESYELYALRIAHAHGQEGRLARSVKRADLDDHLRLPHVLGHPPYAWARRHIVGVQMRLAEEPFAGRPPGSGMPAVEAGVG
jgi:hypothetical protein